MNDPNSIPSPGSQGVPLSPEMMAEENFRKNVQPDFTKHALAELGVNEMILQALSQPVPAPSPMGSVSPTPLQPGQIGHPAQPQQQIQQAPSPIAAGGGSFGAISPPTNPYQSMLNDFNNPSQNAGGTPQQTQNSATLAALENNPSNIPSLY